MAHKYGGTSFRCWGRAQLTLLSVIGVTVVPAVCPTVLGVNPEAPTELWEQRHGINKVTVQKNTLV